MAGLADKKCIPCEGGIPPLTADQIAPLKTQIASDWEVINTHHLERKYRFPNFKTALEFTNQVGEIAETEDHHPNILLEWGLVTVTIWTHKIDGLTESDFYFAAKCDTVYTPAV